MSTFEGLRTLRLGQLEYPEIEIVDLIPLIMSVESDGTSHDYEAATYFHPMVDTNVPPSDAVTFYQCCIDAAVGLHPVWCRTITLGRQKFFQKLSRDEAQCFEAAGLMGFPPTDELIEWWARVGARLRSQVDLEKASQGREAEKLSLAHELSRLRALGIEKTPNWTSIEDNTAGYDILSYDLATPEPTARLIEVKSTIASPLRFYISRNEWEVALKYGATYHFHVWDMRGRKLYQKTVEDIRPHIPDDNAEGRWSNAIIPISV